MNELIIGLLGGGAAVQLLNVLLTLRQNRRQMNASALGEEVTALEKTIRVLQQNFMEANEHRRRETEELRLALGEAEKRCRALSGECERLRQEVARLRSVIRRRPSERQLLIPGTEPPA